MILIELFTIFALLIGGSFLIRVSGIKGWIVPVLGFVTGLSLMLIIGSFQVILILPTNPLSTLLLTILIPMLIWLWYFRKGSTRFFNVVHSILFLGASAGVIFGLHSLSLLNLTPDSYRYAQIGSLFESGNMGVAQPSFLLKRLLGVPLMHAPANLADHFFLVSITPFLSLVTAGILAWFSQKGLQEIKQGSWVINLLPFVGALLLLSNQFFIYNVFYVNGHILYAALLLILAGCSWLYVFNSDVPKNALKMMMFFSIPALIFTRPEAGLHVGLTLLPVLLSDNFPVRLKGGLLGVLGGSLIIWNGFLWLKFVSVGQSAPIVVTGMFCLGFLAIIFIPFLFTRFFGYFTMRLLSVTEIILWVGLAFAAFLEPDVFFVSFSATIENVLMGKGMWGVSLILLWLMFAGSLVFSDSINRVFIRFPVTSFIPLGLLLAHLRDVPYRVSMFDSFNRMFLHIVPLMILFIISSAAADRSNWFFGKFFSRKVKKGFPKA